MTVRIDFEPEAADKRRDWVDLVVQALADDSTGHRGLISAHFHLATDGTHVLNYAEGESGQAYGDALAAPGEGIGASRYDHASPKTSPSWTKKVVGGTVDPCWT
ncbi:hypothetical protein AB0L99_17830 [Streptomyces sp. NPDC051954]|uniref:hypothetical protein n=1 Tax=Streptomyces sp. NPDC051954 TaxID=3155524 RepID=UPI00341D9F67